MYCSPACVFAAICRIVSAPFVVILAIGLGAILRLGLMFMFILGLGDHGLLGEAAPEDTAEKTPGSCSDPEGGVVLTTGEVHARGLPGEGIAKGVGMAMGAIRLPLLTT